MLAHGRAVQVRINRNSSDASRYLKHLQELFVGQESFEPVLLFEFHRAFTLG